MQYNILYACVNHIGKVRKMNQDNIICEKQFLDLETVNINFPLYGKVSAKENAFFGVFDGMGGEEHGEIAAYIAAQNASLTTIGKKAAQDLAEFCRQANTDICEFALENGIESMGTTAAMLAFTSKEIVLCNIGDSKVFRFYAGNLEQISKDHVAITAYGTKPPLSQNLGIPESEMVIEPYFATGKYTEDDIFVICSDGLTDMVSNESITESLTKGDVKLAAEELLQKALENGGRDNISIIVCKIEKEPGWFSKWTRRVKKREGETV